MEVETAGSAQSLPRGALLASLLAALQPLEFVQAVWQGGAAAFGRMDQWSDIDLVIVADDDRCCDVWPPLDAAIRQLGEVQAMLVIPAPPLGLHSQRFYRLREAGPFLLLDLGIFQSSTPDKLLNPAINGNAVIHFDRTGVTHARDVAPADRRALIAARLEVLATTISMFQALVMKEVNRGNHIEAVAFYHAWSLRPLVELLRIKHCPARYNFHTRYVQHDLPSEVVSRLQPMFYVRDLGDLSARRAECEAWCTHLLAELNGSPRSDGE